MKENLKKINVRNFEKVNNISDGKLLALKIISHLLKTPETFTLFRGFR